MAAEQMWAAQYATAGEDAGKLVVAEIPKPEPGPGEVLVRVAVSGVNPTDWKGRVGVISGGSPFPFITPNQDGAGTIEGVGEGVPADRIGERVWLYHAQWQRQRGSAAQYIALPAEQAVSLPDGVSFEVGASLGIPYITAHIALFSGGDPRGTQVLVHGGAGAVGHAAIQLAKFAGARVAATVSSEEKAELARAAGAELVINYKEQPFATAVLEWAPDGVQRIVDVDLAANVDGDAEAIARYGSIVAYNEAGKPVVPTRALMIKNAVVRFLLVYTTPPVAQRAAAGDITAALWQCAIAPLPFHTFPLEQAAEAHDAVQNGATGKVLIEIP